jgi:hypothetical protein
MKRAAPPSERKTPLKRQNATVDAEKVKKVLNFEDAPTEEETTYYYAWTTRELTESERNLLAKAGWGDYLEPTNDDMKLAVLTSSTAKNTGRDFLTIGHPNLDKYGFATFLDKIAKKPATWETKTKIKKETKTESTPAVDESIRRMENEIKVLRQTVQDLIDLIQPTLI